MNRRTLTLGIACLATVALVGCKKGESGSSHPIWGKEDLSSIGQTFQGKSTIRVFASELVGREGGGSISEPVVLEISGDKVVATAQEGGRIEGTFRAVSPCQIAIDGGKRKRPFNFAQNGQDMWVGTTDSGAKLSDGTWLICSYFGYVTMKGERCTFHALTGLSWEPKSFESHPIKCSIEGSTITYEVLRMGNPEKRNTEKVEIVGDALLSSPLKSRLVTR